jgi:hypothetical protein
MHMHERSVKLSQVGTEVLLLMSVPTTDLKLKFLSVCHVTGWNSQCPDEIDASFCYRPQLRLNFFLLTTTPAHINIYTSLSHASLLMEFPCSMYEY